MEISRLLNSFPLSSDATRLSSVTCSARQTGHWQGCFVFCRECAHCTSLSRLFAFWRSPDTWLNHITCASGSKIVLQPSRGAPQVFRDQSTEVQRKYRLCTGGLPRLHCDPSPFGRDILPGENTDLATCWHAETTANNWSFQVMSRVPFGRTFGIQISSPRDLLVTQLNSGHELNTVSLCSLLVCCGLLFCLSLCFSHWRYIS